MLVASASILKDEVNEVVNVAQRRVTWLEREGGFRSKHVFCFVLITLVYNFVI